MATHQQASDMRRPTASTTVTETPSETSRHPINVPSGTIRLRAGPSEQRRIQWAEDVVDNEGMGKKSSKVCCIYHKSRAVGESSSEDESSSDSSSSDNDSEPDTSRAQPSRRPTRRNHHQDHQSDDNHECSHEHNGSGSGDIDSSGTAKAKEPARKERKRSPNAYEKMPRYKKKE